jgi:putative mycofactocin binding protein MftB
MVLRLAEDVRVRQESWGLLLYSHSRHRLSFVRSGRWLSPEHFTGTWNFSEIVRDVTQRNGLTIDRVEPVLRKLTANLLKNGMIFHELC